MNINLIFSFDIKLSKTKKMIKIEKLLGTASIVIVDRF